jgi:hypothetical protein
MKLPEPTRSHPVRLVALGVLFSATCVQLAFQKPYWVVAGEYRVNLFSALLSAACLLSAGIHAQRRGLKLPPRPFWISLALFTLGAVSSLLSLDPKTSGLRFFALAAPSLGGYWCGRILLRSWRAQNGFRWLCLLVLAAVLGLCLASGLRSARIDQFLAINLHVLVNLILLLSFAPLSLLGGRSRLSSTLGVLILGVSFVVLFLSDRRIVLVIMLGLLLVAGLLRLLDRRKVIILVLASVVLGSYLLLHQPGETVTKEAIRTFYRLESYPFSWHILKHHPFFGIGLLAPRTRFLNDYQVWYPHATLEKFQVASSWIRTSENTLLTFMVDLGVPFAVLYSLALLLSVGRLLKMLVHPKTTENGTMTSTPSLQAVGFPPAALFFPLAAALMHYLVFHGLLYPQLCWYFHLLLGLIPPGMVAESTPPHPVPDIGQKGKI